MKTYFARAIFSGMVLAAIAALPSLSHAMDLGIGANTDASVNLRTDRSNSTASATVDGSADAHTDSRDQDDRFFGRIWAALNLNKDRDAGTANADNSSDNNSSGKDDVLSATGTAEAEVTVEGAPSLHFLRAVAVTENSVKIKWLSSERSSAKVWVELDGDIDTEVIPSGSQDSLSFFHHVKVENLEAGTTYHFKVASTDREGNTTVSSLGTFTTEVE